MDRRLHNLNLLTILTLHLGVKSFSHLHFMLNKWVCSTGLWCCNEMLSLALASPH